MKGPFPARPLCAPYKPRPLGQVRRETLQFTPTTAAVNKPELSPVYPDLSRLPHGQDDRCSSQRNMHDLRESLRHTALLNIVAAANSDTYLNQDPAVELGSNKHPGVGSSPLCSSAASHCPQSRPFASPFLLTNGSSHFPVADSSSAGTSTLSLRRVTTLLSPRTRTISIPSKPCTQDLAVPIVHKPASALAQKEEGEVPKALSEAASSGAKRMTGSERLGGQCARPVSVADITFSSAAVVPPLHRHSWEPSHFHVYDHHNAGDASKLSLATSNASTYLHLSANAPSSAMSPSSASVKKAGNCSSPVLARTSGVKNQKEEGAGSNNRRHHSNSNVQHSSHVRWQLTASRKRGLVKRLSEIAKCDAVDMAEAMGQGRRELSIPPMIIFSQMRQEIGHSDDSALHPANDLTDPALPSTAATERERGKKESGRDRQEAKSLRVVSGRHFSLAKMKKSLTRTFFNESVDRQLASLMSDVTLHAHDVACSHDHRDLPSDSESQDAALFVQGVVGRSIESRENQWLPAEPRFHSTCTPPHPRARAPKRRESKPCRLSPQSQGEGCSGNLGEPSPASRARAPRFLRSTTEPHLGGLVNGGSSPLSSHTPALPTLTITSLRPDKSGRAGSDVSSRAGHGGRPPHHLDYASSMRLFKQLDDQCEKLQRQLCLSLSLSLDRQASSLRQHTPKNPPHPPAGGQGVTSHALGDPTAEDSNRRGRSEMSSHRTSAPVPEQLTAVRSDINEPSDVTGKDDAGWGVRVGGGGGGSMWVADASVTADVEVLGEPGASDKQWEAAEGDCRLKNRGEGMPLSENSSLGVNSVGSLPDRITQVTSLDPVLQTTKEPRYQGPSSMVSDNRGRSQFHYINTRRPDVERETVTRRMKYRVLKALDHEVYDDFQHKKFRNSGSATVAKVHREEDRPRVHFYKVKVDGD